MSSVLRNPKSTSVLPQINALGAPLACPLRVLLIVESSGGGTGQHVLDLAHGLITRGSVVHLIYSDLRADARFLARLHTMDGLHSTMFRMLTIPHPSDLAIAWAIRRYVKAKGPFHIVHGHSSKGGAQARLASIGTSSKAVYTLHGLILMDPTVPLFNRLIFWTLERVLTLHTERVIAVSPEEQRAAVRYGFGAHKVTLVPSGMGRVIFAARSVAREKLGASLDEIVIGFVGRLVPQKGCDVLVKAFARAVKGIPNLRLVIVGSGPLEKELKLLSKQLNLDGKIRWLGECDARDVMAGFDIFALASWKEGLPYVIMEALAVGLPVVATASAGVELLVRTSTNGFVVPSGDVSAFASALEKLAGDPGLISKFQAESKKRAGLFTEDQMVDRTLEVYHDIVARRGSLE